MRIAVGGFLHETNTFSSVPARYEDFHIARGAELVAGGVWKELAKAGHTLAPLLHASAHPSGLVTADAFLRIADELLDGLRRTPPPDALFLSLHGAMEVEETGDGEAELLRRVRGVVGQDVFIGGTLDLHGNISPDFARQCDLLTALRTAPHRDGTDTLGRCVRRMVHCLEQGLRPTTALVKLPLLLPGEWAVTEVEPARSLYARLAEIDARRGILDSSILIGCAWTDSPHTCVSVLVSGIDARAARRDAHDLAEGIWRRRAEFGPHVPTADTDEAIRTALASPERPVFLSDSGDNTTAGAAGDSPLVLERLIALGATDAVVAGICDPEAVERCAAAGEGREVELAIGGKLDRQFARPFPTQGTVQRIAPTGRAVVDIRGVTTVLQSDRRAFTRLGQFEEVGINPREHKIVVVKLGYLFPELRAIAAKAVVALTPGFADQRLERLPFRRLRRPIYPLDPEANWTG